MVLGILSLRGRKERKPYIAMNNVGLFNERPSEIQVSLSIKFKLV